MVRCSPWLAYCFNTHVWACTAAGMWSYYAFSHSTNYSLAITRSTIISSWASKRLTLSLCCFDATEGFIGHIAILSVTSWVRCNGTRGTSSVSCFRSIIKRGVYDGFSVQRRALFVKFYLGPHGGCRWTYTTRCRLCFPSWFHQPDYCSPFPKPANMDKVCMNPLVLAFF